MKADHYLRVEESNKLEQCVLCSVLTILTEVYFTSFSLSALAVYNRVRNSARGTDFNKTCMEEMRNTKFRSENLKVRDHSKYLGVDEKIILEWNLEN